MIINSANLDKIRVGFTSLYNSAFTAAAPIWPQIAMMVNSSSGEQKYGWLGQSTRFKEWLGDRVLQNLKSHDFAIKNKSFENTVVVDKDDIEDDTLGVYNPMLQQLGSDAALHPDEMIFELVQNAPTGVCYDGQFFIDTDHPVIDKDGITQSVSNYGGGAGALWLLLDCSKPIKPFIYQKRKDYKLVSLDKDDDTNVAMRKQFIYGVDGRGNAGYGPWQLAYGSKQTLDDANYELGAKTMVGFKADGGKPLRIAHNILLVGPSNQAAGKKLVETKTLPGGGDNPNYGTAKLIVVPWLP